MRLTSHLTSSTASAELKVEQTVHKGMTKLRAFEYEVHVRAKQFERKMGLLSVASLVAILGVGTWALSAYKAFETMMSPAFAALSTGVGLFATCGILVALANSRKVQRYGLDKPLKN